MMYTSHKSVTSEPQVLERLQRNIHSQRFTTVQTYSRKRVRILKNTLADPSIITRDSVACRLCLTYAPSH